MIRSENKRSFRIYSSAKCELVSQAPEFINNEPIRLLKVLPDLTKILVVNYDGECHFFDFLGSEILGSENIDFHTYMITPCDPK